MPHHLLGTIPEQLEAGGPRAGLQLSPGVIRRKAPLDNTHLDAVYVKHLGYRKIVWPVQPSHPAALPNFQLPGWISGYRDTHLDSYTGFERNAVTFILSFPSYCPCGTAFVFHWDTIGCATSFRG